MYPVTSEFLCQSDHKLPARCCCEHVSALKAVLQVKTHAVKAIRWHVQQYKVGAP